MKTIEEEWKTIEEFPEYEISNFGRCRRKNSGRMLKAQILKNNDGTEYSYYVFYKDKKRSKHSAGKLVAQAFIENPNNYKLIQYIDEDRNNSIFTNIKYVPPQIDYAFDRKPHIVPGVTREEQLENLRRKIEMAERFEKALLKGNENEFIYGEVKELCDKIINIKIKGNERRNKEKISSYVLYNIAHTVERGGAIISFKTHIELSIRKYFKREDKKLLTIEFDERRL
jgi:hypothetical protein